MPLTASVTPDQKVSAYVHPSLKGEKDFSWVCLRFRSETAWQASIHVILANLDQARELVEALTDALLKHEAYREAYKGVGAAAAKMLQELQQGNQGDQGEGEEQERLASQEGQE